MVTMYEVFHELCELCLTMQYLFEVSNIDFVVFVLNVQSLACCSVSAVLSAAVQCNGRQCVLGCSLQCNVAISAKLNLKQCSLQCIVVVISAVLHSLQYNVQCAIWCGMGWWVGGGGPASLELIRFEIWSGVDARNSGSHQP